MDSTLTNDLSTFQTNKYSLQIDHTKYANIEYFLTDFELPAISLPEVASEFQNNEGWVPGDQISYEAMTLNFIVDASLKNYKEAINWIKDCQKLGPDAQHDVTLTIYNSHNNPQHKIRFVRAFPTSLSGIPFSQQNTEIEVLTANLGMRYDYWRFED
jgi:hypothetical protein